jgi:hypothetical protein
MKVFFFSRTTESFLEYAGEVWDNCTLADSERLEKIQLEAARIVTGLTSYASILSIYKETGWKKLSVVREKKKTFIIL